MSKIILPLVACLSVTVSGTTTAATSASTAVGSAAASASTAAGSAAANMTPTGTAASGTSDDLDPTEIAKIDCANMGALEMAIFGGDVPCCEGAKGYFKEVEGPILVAQAVDKEFGAYTALSKVDCAAMPAIFTKLKTCPASGALKDAFSRGDLLKKSSCCTAVKDYMKKTIDVVAAFVKGGVAPDLEVIFSDIKETPTYLAKVCPAIAGSVAILEGMDAPVCPADGVKGLLRIMGNPKAYLRSFESVCTKGGSEYCWPKVFKSFDDFMADTSTEMMAAGLAYHGDWLRTFTPARLNKLCVPCLGTVFTELSDNPDLFGANEKLLRNRDISGIISGPLCAKDQANNYCITSLIAGWKLVTDSDATAALADDFKTLMNLQASDVEITAAAAKVETAAKAVFQGDGVCSAATRACANRMMNSLEAFTTIPSTGQKGFKNTMLSRARIITKACDKYKGLLKQVAQKYRRKLQGIPKAWFCKDTNKDKLADNLKSDWAIWAGVPVADVKITWVTKCDSATGGRGRRLLSDEIEYDAEIQVNEGIEADTLVVQASSAMALPAVNKLLVDDTTITTNGVSDVPEETVPSSAAQTGLGFVFAAIAGILAYA